MPIKAVTTACFLIAGAAWGADRSPLEPLVAWSHNDQQAIKRLVAEMAEADLPNMKTIPVQRFVIPNASVDVMRVKLEETYEVEGVGKDTVQLSGWIAVAHDNPHAAPGETGVKWGTAISDTEFVGMDLRGESPIFGPVTVRLAPGARSVGQVGRLKFGLVDSLLLEMGYRRFRSQDPSLAAIDSAASNLRTSPTVMGYASRALETRIAQAKAKKLTGDAANVEKTIRAVLSAINGKKPDEMMKYYSKSPDALFFNATLAMPARGAKDYIQELGKMFANIREIRATVDEESFKISVAGRVAIARLTGANDVVDTDGNRGNSQWLWTLELEREGDQWLITHDHFSFTGGGARSLELRDNPGKLRAACRANALASISMPKLDLNMTTQRAVVWFSEVDTIPPVGYTASVSFTPTPLVDNGRQVATLTSGVVKFREVVRTIPLEGTRTDMKVSMR